MFDSISDKFSGIMRTFAGKSKITEKNIQDAVEEIKVALLDADVNLRVVRRFINGTMEEALGEKVLKAVDPGQQFVKIVYDHMVALLADEENQTPAQGSRHHHRHPDDGVAGIRQDHHQRQAGFPPQAGGQASHVGCRRLGQAGGHPAAASPR